ncbi:hypothetical protein F2Q68_00043086 [Brassica cretica]|uniref:Uncharacterized protein n=1 Tax=Brassica cretica TaxID=69181 RepID=A0A8S9LJK0_BRACR|nr:hypothetical protein F2Q68_00043086 [Brassica cretica]
MYHLEESGNFGVFWSLLSEELHRRVKSLAMYGDLPTVILSPSLDIIYRFELAFQCYRFEVNQHLIADVMPVLLMSGQSTLREEAFEEMKDCRSMRAVTFYSTGKTRGEVEKRTPKERATSHKRTSKAEETDMEMPLEAESAPNRLGTLHRRNGADDSLKTKQEPTGQ